MLVFAPQVCVQDRSAAEGHLQTLRRRMKPGNHWSSCSWLQSASPRLHTQRELHPNLSLSWNMELCFALLRYPHPPDPVSAPGKEERMVQAVRMQGDRQCRMWSQPMVLHVTVSAPGTEAKPALSSSGQSDTSCSNKAVSVSASSARPRAQPPVEGRRKERSSLWVRTPEQVTVTPCAGSEEERKESGTAWGGTTLNFSGSVGAGRLGTLLWVTTRWLAGNLKHTEARSNSRAVITTQVFLNPNLVPRSRAHAALHISLRHFLFCLYRQCLKIPAFFVLQIGPFGNGARVWIYWFDLGIGKIIYFYWGRRCN